MGNCGTCLNNRTRPQPQQWQDIELDYLSATEAQIIAKPLLKNQKGDLPSPVYNSIGFLVFKNHIGSILNSTAVIISPNLILTAARNVYDSISNQDYQDFKFYPVVNGEIKQSQGYSIQAYRYPSQYKNCAANRKLRYEYALLKLVHKPQKIIKNQQCLRIVPACTECPVEMGKRLSLYGYPTINKIVRGLAQYWTAIQSGVSQENVVVTYMPKQLRINYAVSATAGLRGGPVMFGGNFVGIHVGSISIQAQQSNLGRLFTFDLLRNINEWCLQLFADKFTIDDNICDHIKQIMSYGRKSLASNGRPLSDIGLSKANKGNKQSNLLDLRNQNLSKFEFSAYRDIQKLFAKKNCFVHVDLSYNTKLTQLGLTQNYLQSIDLSKNFELQKVSLSQNHLEQIDLSNNTKIVELGLRNNQLKKLDLSKNKDLVKLHLRNNKLTQLDLTNNSLLNEIGLSQNSLQYIDLTQNIQLVQLGLSSNNLSFIDLKANNHLKFLNMSNNRLRTVDLTNNIQLTQLDLSSNQLDYMDITKNTAIVDVNLSRNNLITLDLSNNTFLRKLTIDYNRVIALDLTKNTQLTNLSLVENNIVIINLKKNISLIQLNLYKNKIPSIDLLYQHNLQILNVSDNALDNLNLSNSKKISEINAADNKLSTLNFYFNYPLFQRSEQIKGVGFGIANQKKLTCKVTILSTPQNGQDCTKFKEILQSEYSKEKNNKHNCKYNFVVEKG